MSTDTNSAPIVNALDSELADHPLLRHIPVWSREEPEFQALLESIRERGLDYPVLIDSERNVIDGRNRRNCLALLGRPIPCRVVPAGDAATIIVASLVNRRHLSKGAQAYLAVPLFESVLAESKERNLAMLRAGGESVPHSVRNAAEIAEQVGVGLRLFELAMDLHRRFAKNPAQKAEFEPKIIAGELGLGAAIQAIAGQESTRGKARATDKLENLITRGFRDLGTRFAKWGQLPDESRAELRVKVTAATEAWPDDVVQAAASAWRKAGRI